MYGKLKQKEYKKNKGEGGGGGRVEKHTTGKTETQCALLSFQEKLLNFV